MLVQAAQKDRISLLHDALDGQTFQSLPYI